MTTLTVHGLPNSGGCKSVIRSAYGVEAIHPSVLSGGLQAGADPPTPERRSPRFDPPDKSPRPLRDLTRLKKEDPQTDRVGMRVLWIALIALMASGCFVSDELDKGNTILDQHGNKKRAKRAVAQEQAPPETAEEPGLWDSLVGWVQGEPDPTAPRAQRKEPGLWDSLVGWVDQELEPEPPPPDPEDAPVRCRIGKSESFSSLRDCQARGGKPVSRDPVR